MQQWDMVCVVLQINNTKPAYIILKKVNLVEHI